jgi:hypothetical protein
MEFAILLLFGLFVGKFYIAPILSDEFWEAMDRLKREKRMRRSRAYFKARNKRIREEYTAAMRSKIIRDAEEQRARKVKQSA